MMNKDNQIQGLDNYLKKEWQIARDNSDYDNAKELEKGYCNYLVNNEWIYIFLNLEISGGIGNYTLIDWDATYMEYKMGLLEYKMGLFNKGLVHSHPKKLGDGTYPFEKEFLSKIIDLHDLTIGNPELGEVVRINHIEPLKYLTNLSELSICNNTVTSLKPIWGHPNLKRVWIENTLIPLEERRLFKDEHPDCELAEQVYL